VEWLGSQEPEKVNNGRNAALPQLNGRACLTEELPWLVG